MRIKLLMPVLFLLLVACACGHQQSGRRLLTIEPLNFIPSTTSSTTTSTTITIPPTTTTSAKITAKPSPPHTTSTTRVVQKVAVAPSGGDFWERLSNCESPTNSWAGTYKGYFQFSDSNVWNANHQWGFNYTPTASYEDQKAAAQYLAAHSNPYGQWPVCWPRAVRGG